MAPAGFRLAAPTEVLTGAALIGQAVLYRWPTEGWARGTVARSTRAAGFTHVVRYGRTSALGSAETPLLLDGTSSRLGRALGAPPAGALAWLPFSRTPVMGLPGTQIVGCSPDKPMLLISSSHEKQTAIKPRASRDREF